MGKNRRRRRCVRALCPQAGFQFVPARKTRAVAIYEGLVSGTAKGGPPTEGAQLFGLVIRMQKLRVGVKKCRTSRFCMANMATYCGSERDTLRMLLRRPNASRRRAP